MCSIAPGPQDVRYLYCLFYVIFIPLRWIYYQYKKWHYYLLTLGLGSSNKSCAG
ncbi:hypothetical protein ACS0TY_018859 [Phlomoides rotata]